MGGTDWIDAAQSRVRWRVLINAVMNLQVTQNVKRTETFEVRMKRLEDLQLKNDLIIPKEK